MVYPTMIFSLNCYIFIRYHPLFTFTSEVEFIHIVLWRGHYCWCPSGYVNDAYHRIYTTHVTYLSVSDWWRRVGDINECYTYRCILRQQDKVPVLPDILCMWLHQCWTPLQSKSYMCWGNLKTHRASLASAGATIKANEQNYMTLWSTLYLI